ncbi:unnamed protein product [Rhizophagus irregularis]|nr:unnamed protein product [Rhizophagus irregularis]
MRRRYSHNKPVKPIPNSKSFQDINDDDNAYGSINPQDYNDEIIFSQDNVNSSDTEKEEESDNEYNYEEEEEEADQ